MTLRSKTATALPSYVLQKGLGQLRAFRHDQSGTMTYPTIAFFLMMLGIGGIGVDLMRMERDRAHLQATLDRAVLAAADLDQTLDAKLVVQDYLTKAGLGEYYDADRVIPDEGLGYKRVEASIDATFEAHLLKFSNGTDMPIYAASTAEESIDGLEISLVLDVSGSMNSNSRLSNLKVAAKDFIETMVDNTTDGKMSISIVPYATQVSVTDELFAEFSTSGENDFANCINFEASDFQSTTLPTTTSYDRTMHFGPWYTNETRSSGSPVPYEVCDNLDSREIMAFQKDETTLKNFIDSLSAWGNTSIDIGMKWGTALLDPSTRPAINALTTGSDPEVPIDFAARPAEYTDTDTLKIIVLMTDGQNTSQYYIDNGYRSGNSDVWYDTSKGYSVYDSYYNDYYRYNEGSWRSTPAGGSSAKRLTYPDLFSYTSVRWLRYRLYRYAFGSSAGTSFYNSVLEYNGNSVKNTRTKDICDAAKAQGIIVYTIGFEAPSDGQAVLQDCASTDSHYFDVDGLEIADAFNSIATSIRQLRLTQ